MKILVVDDSEVTRLFLKNCIENAGYEVIGESIDGEDGIIKYKELNPDLVLLDITMPKMNGIDCLKAIMEYDREAKVIIVTSSPQKRVIIEMFRMGAVDCIPKPFEDEDVIKKLKEIENKIKK